MDAYALIVGVSAGWEMPEDNERRRARARALLRGTALAGAAGGLLIAAPALAADECGVTGHGAVTCTAAGNPYPGGISYIEPVYDLTVNLGDGVEVDSGANPGVLLVGFNGVAVTLDAAADTLVATTGDDAAGVVILASGGGTGSATVGDVSTTGNSAPGVYAYGAEVNITVNGAVSTTGTGSPGVIGYSAQGNVTIANNGSVSTTGNASAGLEGFGYGDVTISGAGTISTAGNGSRGINAASSYGTLTITTGDITTTGVVAQGIHATNGGYGIVIDAGSVTTTGNLSDGIAAVTRRSDISITSTGTLSTTGTYAFGTYGVSSYGDSTIVVNNVSTTGDDSVGVLSAGYNASVTVNGAVTTTGTIGDYGSGANAVVVIAHYGTADATINGSVTTSGDAAIAVAVQGYYDTTVTNAGAIRTSGADADGLRVGSYYGNVAVHNSGTVRTGGNGSIGIAATSYYDLTIDGRGSVSTSGDAASGISARGIGTVSVTAGQVATAGQVSDAIFAYGGVGVTVDAQAVSTAGRRSSGIVALSYGDVSVTAGSVTTSGNASDGILATAPGAGSTITIAAGDVAVSGAGSTAIDALGIGGAVDVSVTGDVSSKRYDAVFIGAATTASLDVAAGGSVIGRTDGVAIISGDGTTITNAGVIAGRDGFAIAAVGGAATIHNSGLISGAVSLTAGDDRIDNSGVFTASGDSDFGAGDDRFANSGTVRLRAAAGKQHVVFAGLEEFRNSGLVDLRNGTVGDSLTLPGAYVGAGGTLGLDIHLNGTATAGDLLNVGTATGSTRVALNVSGSALLIPGTTIVQADAASSANAFSLAGGVQHDGLIDYQIAYRPGTFAYQLVGTPGSTVFHMLKVGEGAQTLWYRSADAVTSHLRMLRDGEWQASDAKGGVWLEMFGGLDKRRARDIDTTFGVDRSIDSAYKQDYFGGQAGADFGSATDTGGFVFGVTAGYQSSTLRFSYDGDRFAYDALNAGVYGGFKLGPLFVNALGKYDHYTITARSPIAGFHSHFDGNGYGAQVEAGARLGSDDLFFEPVASIAYVRTDLDDLAVLGQRIDFDTMDGLRGKAGVRLGSNMTLAGGSRLTAYVSGMAVHEFDGDDGLAFSSGATTLRFDNHRIGTYGQGTVGFDITTPGGVTGFIEGTGDYNKNYRGGGGRAGIRVKF